MNNKIIIIIKILVLRYFNHFKFFIELNISFFNFFIKILPFATSLFSVGLVFLWLNQKAETYNSIYNFSSVATKAQEFLLNFYSFLSAKWYFDAIYNEFIVMFGFKHGYNTTFKTLDKGLLEMFGPNGISIALYKCANELRKMHSGQVYYYAYFMLLFLMVNIIAIHSVIYQ